MRRSAEGQSITSVLAVLVLLLSSASRVSSLAHTVCCACKGLLELVLAVMVSLPLKSFLFEPYYQSSLTHASLRKYLHDYMRMLQAALVVPSRWTDNASCLVPADCPDSRYHVYRADM